MSRIVDIVRQIVKSQIKDEIVMGTVKSFSSSNWTATIELNKGATVEEVTVRSVLNSEATGIFIEPKVGSCAVCSLTDGKIENLKILLFSEIENVEILPGQKMKLRGDAFGGLVKVQEMTNEINEIKQDLNTLKTIFNEWQITSVEVSAAAIALKPLITPWSGQPLNLAVKENLENENVSHG